MKDEEGGAFPATDSCSSVTWLLYLCLYSSLARYLKIRYNGFMIILHRWIHFILKLANRRNDERLLTDIINSFTLITSSQLDADEIVAFCKTYGDDYLSGFYDFTKENYFTTNLSPLL